MEDGEDPFASIIKKCIPTDSQEEKLGSCRYAGASPDHSDSVLSSPWRTPPEQPAIFMASPPGSGSVAQNTPRRNDSSRIYTERASSSSQPYPSGPEYPKPSATTAAVDHQNVDDHVHAEVIDLESEEDGDEEGITKKKTTVAESRKRKLPSSIGGCENASDGSMKIGSFKELIEVVQVVFGMASDGSHGGENVSLLEIAQRQGWEFPRPRWWPPEGFDD